MVDYRSILRLHSQGNSQREIEREVNSSRHTISEVLIRADAAGITWPLDENIRPMERLDIYSLQEFNDIMRRILIARNAKDYSKKLGARASIFEAGKKRRYCRSRSFNTSPTLRRLPPYGETSTYNTTARFTVCLLNILAKRSE